MGHQGIERRVAGLDAPLEQGDVVGDILLEASGQAVIAGQIQIDEGVAALGPSASTAGRGRGLQQLAWQLPGLGEQEEADLGHVGASGDVDQVLLFLGAKGVVAREVVQGGEHLLEVPGVGEGHLVQHHLGLGGHRAHVPGHLPGQPGELLLVKQLEALNQEVLLLAHRHRGTPLLPPLWACAAIQDRAQDAQDDPGFVHGEGHESFISSYRFRYQRIGAINLGQDELTWVRKGNFNNLYNYGSLSFCAGLWHGRCVINYHLS